MPSLVEWDRFAAEVAEIADVPASELRRETRLIEDLGLDSIQLVEIAVVLISGYGAGEAGEGLGGRSWDGVTVGELFEEARGHVR
jgi:hypothetical protein